MGHGPEHRAENGHAGHAACQTAQGTLHGFVGADQGGQLMLSAGHAGEQGQGVAAEGRHQGRQHQEIAVIQGAQAIQPGEGPGNGKARRGHGAHVGKRQGMRLSVGQDSGQGQGQGRCQQQTLQGGAAGPHRPGQQQHAAHGGKHRPAPGLVRAAHRRQQLVGGDDGQGRQQQGRGPGRGDAQHRQQGGNPHHSHQYPLFHSCILSISRRRTAGRGSGRR